MLITEPHALREKDACTYLGLGRTKFREMVAAGQLPKPHRVGGCRLWLVTELKYGFNATIGAANDNAPLSEENSWDDVLNNDQPE